MNSLFLVRGKVILALGVLALIGVACQSNRGGLAGEIVFESYRDGNAEIYLMSADGSNQVNLTNNPAYDGTPDWAPDGQRLAYTSERSGNPEVYLMDPDGENPNQLTDGGGFNVVPAWSPDGSQILFVSNRTYNEVQEGGYLEIPGNTKIWLMDADGGNFDRQTSRFGLDMFASWSPDGNKFVFMSVRDDNPEIYLHDENQREINLTNNPANDLNPAWSPDGSKIAFMSDRGGNLDIYILEVETNTLTQLTQDPDNEGDPAWSPDGAWLAFTSDRDGNVEIYLMAADGSNQQRLTENQQDDIHPKWRP